MLIKLFQEKKNLKIFQIQVLLKFIYLKKFYFLGKNININDKEIELIKQNFEDKSNISIKLNGIEKNLSAFDFKTHLSSILNMKGVMINPNIIDSVKEVSIKNSESENQSVNITKNII